MNRDVTPSSRPIIADVRNPDEITAAFDWVIYQKGSSVIYMMKETLGVGPYHNAIKVKYLFFVVTDCKLIKLQAYLEEAQYSNATELTLLKHIQDAIDGKYSPNGEEITVDGQACLSKITNLFTHISIFTQPNLKTTCEVY